MVSYAGDKLKAVHSFMVFPSDLNYNSSLFGGKIMAEMDIAALKVCRRALYGTNAYTAVTVKFDSIIFKKAAYSGDLITMTAEIKAFGKSSITVKITVTKENSPTGEVEEFCKGTAIFVAVDKNSNPVPHGLSF